MSTSSTPESLLLFTEEDTTKEKLGAAFLYWELCHPDFCSVEQLKVLWEFEAWLLEEKRIKVIKPVNYIDEQLAAWIQRRRYTTLKQLNRVITVARVNIPYYSRQTQGYLSQWIYD